MDLKRQQGTDLILSINANISRLSEDGGRPRIVVRDVAILVAACEAMKLPIAGNPVQILAERFGVPVIVDPRLPHDEFLVTRLVTE